MKRVLIAAFLAVIFVYSNAYAVKVKKWSGKETKLAGAGQYLGVMYSSEGVIVAGFETSAQTYREDFVFRASIYDETGAPIFGGGTPAEIVRLGSGGFTHPFKFNVNGKGSSAASALELIAETGMLVAGFTGGGAVAVKEKGENVLYSLCVLPAETIWDIEYAGNNHVYVATGPMGRIFRVSLKSGQYEAWGETRDTNIRFILKSEDGRVLFGGGETGNLYDLKGKNRVDVVYHFPEEAVVKAIQYQNGILAAVNRLKQPPEEDHAKRYREYFKQFSSLKDQFGATSQGSAPVDAYNANLSNMFEGSVYFLGMDYRVDSIISLDDYILDIAADKNGDIFLATGPGGKVYMVADPLSDARKMWIAHDFDYQNVTSILMKDGYPGYFAVAGNEAVVHRRSGGKSESGRFISQVFTPGSPANWGTLYWDGNGAAAYSRHGNTPVPDDTWTPWIERKTGYPGELDRDVWIFSQLKFDIGVNGGLKGFDYYYVEKNQRPVVKNVKVSEKRQSERGPLREITWETADLNQDDLECAVWIKEENQAEWIRISREDDIEQNRFLLYTDLFPDGNYLVKATACDMESNFGDGAAGFGISDEFLIDNGRPEIIDIAFNAEENRFTGKVRDDYSVISEMAYSIDGGDWVLFLPLDGILDQKVETISLSAPEHLETGKHVIAFRFLDEAGNRAGTVFQFDCPGL